MSECVVRMKMPTGCASCPMADDEARFCKAAKEYIPMLSKPSWCPIICQLPEGHGRLVDADEILKKSKDKYGDFEITAVAMEFYGAPTIVPAEAERSET